MGLNANPFGNTLEAENYKMRRNFKPAAEHNSGFNSDHPMNGINEPIKEEESDTNRD